MKISVSNLAKYKTCPQQYLWDWKGSPQPVDRMPRKKNQFTGHVLQKLVERFYTEKWWKNPLETIALFRNNVGEVAQQFTKKEAIVWYHGEFEEKLRIFQETVPKILAVIRGEKLLMKGVETEFDLQIPLGPHTVFGRGDFLYKTSDGLMVLDGKGGSQYGKYVDSNQLKWYGLGVENSLLKTRPKRFGFWWYRFGRIQWKKFKPEAFEELKQESIVALTRLESGDFDPISGRHCRYCDYRTQCQTGIDFVNSKATTIPELDIPDNSGFVSL